MSFRGHNLGRVLRVVMALDRPSFRFRTALTFQALRRDVCGRRFHKR